MNYLAQIADRVIGRPLLIHPSKVEVILEVLSGRIGMDFEALSPEASRFRAKSSAGGMYRVENGAAIIPVIGSLVNRGAWIGASSGLTSYEGIEAQLDAALADPQVQQIVLDIDSPGGEATGTYRLEEKIRKINSQKPVTAYINDMAASAAYGIAAQAGKIIVSQSSIVGSIGVVMVHLDRSAEMTKRGIKPTFIYAGAHKVDGNFFAPLPEAVHADLQAMIDQHYSMFVSAVAAGRTALSETAIRATEARTFIGADAVRLGLADAVGSLEDVFQGRNGPGGSARFSSKKESAMTAEAAAPSADERIAALESKIEAALVVAHDKGVQVGAEAERGRQKAILGHAAAEGRKQMAEHLAFETGMSAPDAVALLEKSPKEAEATYSDRKAGAGALGMGFNAAEASAKTLMTADDIIAKRQKEAQAFNARR